MNTNHSNGRRVAVTGIGFITPIGNDEETVWSNMVEGSSGIGPITRFDTTGFDTKIAAEVKGFNPEDYMDRKTARHIGRYCQFALAASKQALAQAGLDPAQMDPDDVGVIVSSGIGGLEEIEKSHTALMQRGHFFLRGGILANGAQILRSNHELFVLHKTQGGWKLARYSFSSVLPAA